MSDSANKGDVGEFYLKLSSPQPGTFRKSVGDILDVARCPAEVFRAAWCSNALCMGYGLTDDFASARRYFTRDEALADAKLLENYKEGIARLRYTGRSGMTQGVLEWSWSDGPLDVEKESVVRVSELVLSSPRVGVRQSAGVVDAMTGVKLDSDVGADDTCFLYVDLPGWNEQLRCEVSAQEFNLTQKMLQQKFEVIDGESFKAAKYAVGAQLSEQAGDWVWFGLDRDAGGNEVGVLTSDFELALKRDLSGWETICDKLPHACVVKGANMDNRAILVVEPSADGAGDSVRLLAEDGMVRWGMMENVVTERCHDNAGQVRCRAEVVFHGANTEAGEALPSLGTIELPPDFIKGLAGKASERKDGGQLQYEVMDVESIERMLNTPNLGVIADMQSNNHPPAPAMGL